MSPVTVGDLTTEVVPEVPAPPTPAPAGGTPVWEELDRVRRAEAQLRRDRARTRAEGSDA
jgi:hypothetical protein